MIYCISSPSLKPKYQYEKQGVITPIYQCRLANIDIFSVAFFTPCFLFRPFILFDSDFSTFVLHFIYLFFRLHIFFSGFIANYDTPQFRQLFSWLYSVGNLWLIVISTIVLLCLCFTILLPYQFSFPLLCLTLTFLFIFVYAAFSKSVIAHQIFQLPILFRQDKQNTKIRTKFNCTTKNILISRRSLYANLVLLRIRRGNCSQITCCCCVSEPILFFFAITVLVLNFSFFSAPIVSLFSDKRLSNSFCVCVYFFYINSLSSIMHTQSTHISENYPPKRLINIWTGCSNGDESFIFNVD